MHIIQLQVQHLKHKKLRCLNALHRAVLMQSAGQAPVGTKS